MAPLVRHALLALCAALLVPTALCLVKDLIDDDVDPQLEDATAGVEWIPPAELQRRMQRHQSQAGHELARSTLKALGTKVGREAGYSRVSIAELSPDAGGGGNAGPRRTQDDDTVVEVATGPVYPVFQEDLPPNLTETFMKPATLQRDDGVRPVPIPVPASCDESRIVDCKPDLSECLGVDVSDRGRACACFLKHGQCYRAAGCIELLPREDVKFCFGRFFCPYDSCVGSGGVGLWVSAGGVAAVVVATLALVLQAT